MTKGTTSKTRTVEVVAIATIMVAVMIETLVAEMQVMTIAIPKAIGIRKITKKIGVVVMVIVVTMVTEKMVVEVVMVMTTMVVELKEAGTGTTMTLGTR